MELPLRLRSDRKGMLPLVVGALVFVALGFLVLRWEPTIGWLAIAFFGLCAVVFCINLLPNSSYLRLTPEGFTVCSAFKCRSTRWRDVGKFGVAQIVARKVVGWDPAEGASGIAEAAKAMGGYSSTLPENYGFTAEELAELLNRLRDQYATQTI